MLGFGDLAPIREAQFAEELGGPENLEQQRKDVELVGISSRDHDGMEVQVPALQTAEVGKQKNAVHSDSSHMQVVQFRHLGHRLEEPFALGTTEPHVPKRQ